MTPIPKKGTEEAHGIPIWVCWITLLFLLSRMDRTEAKSLVTKEPMLQDMLEALQWHLKVKKLKLSVFLKQREQEIEEMSRWPNDLAPRVN